MKIKVMMSLFAIVMTSNCMASDANKPPAKASTNTAIFQWSDAKGKTVFGDAPPKNAKNIRRIEVLDPNSVPPPPVHSHQEEPLGNANAAQAAKPALSPRAQRRAECNAKLKEADDFEKSDRSDLARNIYPWIVANCPENRTGRIGGRIRLVPVPEVDESETPASR